MSQAADRPDDAQPSSEGRPDSSDPAAPADWRGWHGSWKQKWPSGGADQARGYADEKYAQETKHATGKPRGDGIGSGKSGRTKRKLFGPVSVPIALFVLMALLAVAHQGRIVELVYPGMAFLVAMWLYRFYPAHYLSFVCWLFFLSPEIRRLADFFTGAFNPVSTIMVTPLLGAAISGFAIVTNVRMLAQRRAIPILLVLSALLYAYAIGIVRAGFSAATFSLVTAILPALVGFRLVAGWKEYPEYERVLLKTFVFGSIVMGAYGVYEFINPPPWDAFWLLQSGMTSEGDPVPFGWRVASTMNSSGPLANTLMVCIVISLAAKGKLRMASGIGLPALMFTSVRSAWGGTLIGLLYPIAMLDGRSRIRIIGSVVAVVALFAPIVMFSDAADRFTSRLASVQDISQDNSFQVRAAMYSSFFSKALSDVSGKGFGGTGVASKLADEPADDVILVFDSGLMEVPYVMGWPGTLLYVIGIGMLLKRALAASLKQPNNRVCACGVGLAVATVAMMLFSNTLTGVSGMFFFIGTLMPVNGLRYARYQRACRQLEKARRAGQSFDAVRPQSSAGAVATPARSTRYGAFDGAPWPTRTGASL